jgi:hypothetical protein
MGVLTAEMRRYEYDIGPTGQISYAAPSGYHDDCVMALALPCGAAALTAWNREGCCGLERYENGGGEDGDL